jgi:hypothetical protein
MDSRIGPLEMEEEGGQEGSGQFGWSCGDTLTEPPV